MSRRRILVRLGVAGALVVGGGAVAAAFFTRRSREDAIAEAKRLVQESYAALRAGNIAVAADHASKARALDEESQEAKVAWVHTTGMSLMEADGDGARAVGFVSEVRRLGLRGTHHAFANLAAAVAMKNDRFARRLVDQHKEQNVPGDAFYDFAAGAALDLDCDPALAEAAFSRSASQWQDAVLPRLRRVRSLLFDERFEEARVALSEVRGADAAAVVLAAALGRLKGDASVQAHVDPATVVDLPRSVRPLAQALLLGGDDAAFGIDAALGDIDSALVATTCAQIALVAGDLQAAHAAAEAAQRFRPELTRATVMLVRVKLLRGDLAGAKQAADHSGEAEPLSIVHAIGAYEERRTEDLVKIDEEAKSTGLRGWALLPSALGLLGVGKMPTEPELQAAIDAREPWADVLLVDLALAASDVPRAKRVMDRWSDVTEPRTRRRKRVADR